MASPYLSKLDILIDLYLTLNARSGEEAKPRARPRLVFQPQWCRYHYHIDHHDVV